MMFVLIDTKERYFEVISIEEIYVTSLLTKALLFQDKKDALIFQAYILNRYKLFFEVVPLKDKAVTMY